MPTGAEVASAYVSLLPSLRGFGTQLDKELDGTLRKSGDDGGRKFGGAFAGGFGKIAGPLAAVAGGAAIGGFIKDSIAQASDLNEAGTKLQAIFGDASKQVQDFAATGPKALGQNRLAVLDSAATFGTFGKAAGLAGGDLAKFSTGFAGLSTDLASFFNTDPAEAAEAISSGLRGEAEPLRRFGVLLDDATLKSEAMRLGLISTTKTALTPQQKVLAAQAVIYKQTKDAQGDFAKTSGGLANQQRILAAQFTDIKGRVGSALLPILVKLAQFATGTLMPALGGISGAVSGVGKFISPVIAGFQVFFGALTGRSEVGEFSGALQKVNNIGVALSDFITTRMIPVFQSIASFITGQLVPAVVTIFQHIASNLAPAFSALGGFLTERVLPAVSGLWARFQQVLPTLQMVGLAIVKVAGFVLNLATKILGTLIPVILRVAGPILTGLYAALGVGIGVIAKVLEWGGKLVGFFRDLPGKLAAVGRGMFDFIKDAFKGAINFVIGVWNRLEFKIPGFDPPGPGPKFSGFTLGVPDIPLLATGGITNGPTLAGIGDNKSGHEAVVPLTRSGRIQGEFAASVAEANGGGLDPEIVRLLDSIDKRLKAIEATGPDKTGQAVGRALDRTTQRASNNSRATR